MQDCVDVWAAHSDGRVESFAPNGDRAPFASREVQHPEPVFPLAVDAGETVQVFVRLATHDGYRDAVKAWRPQARGVERAEGGDGVRPDLARPLPP